MTYGHVWDKKHNSGNTTKVSEGRTLPPNAGKGRKKGSLNKTTRAVKDALSFAFEEIGGVEALKVWAVDNPTQFYQLWGKLLPLQVSGDEDNPINIITKVVLEPLCDTGGDND